MYMRRLLPQVSQRSARLPSLRPFRRSFASGETTFDTKENEPASDNDSKLSELRTLASSIVDAAVQRDKALSWHYPKEKPEENFLKRDLRAHSGPVRVRSREYKEFFSDSSENTSPSEYVEAASTEVTVGPGTFVELRRYLSFFFI